MVVALTSGDEASADHLPARAAGRRQDHARRPGVQGAGPCVLDLAEADVERLCRVVSDTSTDVIELRWALQHERRALALVRRSGTQLVVWAHPEDMQARSGRDEPLSTPVPRLKIRGGFGQNGTGCREFRHLQRACGNTLMLVDLALEEAAEAVRACVAAIRGQDHAPPPSAKVWPAGWKTGSNSMGRVHR